MLVYQTENHAVLTNITLTPSTSIIPFHLYSTFSNCFNCIIVTILLYYIYKGYYLLIQELRASLLIHLSLMITQPFIKKHFTTPTSVWLIPVISFISPLVVWRRRKTTLIWLKRQNDCYYLMNKKLGKVSTPDQVGIGSWRKCRKYQHF